MLYLFAAVGLRADLRTLIAGGKPLAILLLAASVFIVLQKITGVSVANMTAVTQQYGAAHRAMIVVPLVCGFYIDIVNALIIDALVSFQKAKI